MHDFLCEQLKIKQPWVDYPRIEDAILKCEELMEEERKAFILAYEDGVSEGSNCYAKALPATDYYNETFDIKHYLPSSIPHKTLDSK